MKFTNIQQKTAFYADIEKSESADPSDGFKSAKKALFLEFPTIGKRMFVYLQSQKSDSVRYIHTESVTSVLVSQHHVRVQTENAVYFLENLEQHKGRMIDEV